MLCNIAWFQPKFFSKYKDHGLKNVIIIKLSSLLIKTSENYFISLIYVFAAHFQYLRAFRPFSFSASWPLSGYQKTITMVIALYLYYALHLYCFGQAMFKLFEIAWAEAMLR